MTRIRRRRWLDSVKDDIKGKGLLGEEVYNQATWRSISSYIDLSSKWLRDEGEEEEAVPVLLHKQMLCLLMVVAVIF